MTPCRKRTGNQVLRAEKVVNLTTSYHKVLSEDCESRNNHWRAVVVEDLATQWLQSCPCQTKSSQDTDNNVRKFLEPTVKPKVIYADSSLEFSKACD